jgi:hypothetical protein
MYAALLSFVALVTVGADAPVGPVDTPAAVTYPREPVQIFVVNPLANRTVGHVPVAIYTLDGTCIRRGATRIYGESFLAEEHGQLDPAYKMLRVAALHPQTGAPVNTLLIVFDPTRNNWRPTVVYEHPKTDAKDAKPTSWTARPQYDFSTGKLRPLPPETARVPQIRIFLSGKPNPGDDFPTDGQKVAAPPAPPSGDVKREAEESARVVEAGRPLLPPSEMGWSPYGLKWVRGRTGMYYEVELPK